LAPVLIAATLDEATQIIGGDVRIAVANPQDPSPIEAYESIFSFRQAPAKKAIACWVRKKEIQYISACEA